jgi:hypothetical protein
VFRPNLVRQYNTFVLHSNGVAAVLGDGGERLDSWKEIASYLKRGVRTVQRWEREAELPVHRLATEKRGVVRLQGRNDLWWQQRPVFSAGSGKL